MKDDNFKRIDALGQFGSWNRKQELKEGTKTSIKERKAFFDTLLVQSTFDLLYTEKICKKTLPIRLISHPGVLVSQIAASVNDYEAGRFSDKRYFSYVANESCSEKAYNLLRTLNKQDLKNISPRTLGAFTELIRPLPLGQGRTELHEILDSGRHSIFVTDDEGKVSNLAAGVYRILHLSNEIKNRVYGLFGDNPYFDNNEVSDLMGVGRIMRQYALRDQDYLMRKTANSSTG